VTDGWQQRQRRRRRRRRRRFEELMRLHPGFQFFLLRIRFDTFVDRVAKFDGRNQSIRGRMFIIFSRTDDGRDVDDEK
jgi:hypothetical protein